MSDEERSVNEEAPEEEEEKKDEEGKHEIDFIGFHSFDFILQLFAWIHQVSFGGLADIKGSRSDNAHFLSKLRNLVEEMRFLVNMPCRANQIHALYQGLVQSLLFM